MKKSIFILINLFSIFVLAKSLVVPAYGVPFEIYHERCQKDGYDCTISYFTSRLKTEAPAEYENMIANLDLLKPEQVEQIEESLTHILTQTNIDIEQAESLLDLIDKAALLKKSPKLIYLKSVLTKSLSLLKIIPEIRTENLMQQSSVYMIFKKVISQENYIKIKSQMAGIAAYKISYDSYPVQLNTKSGNVHLLTGNCEAPIYPPSSYSLSQEQIVPLFQNGCAFSEEWSTSTNFMKEHKTSLILTGLAIGAAVLFSKYNVEMRF